MVKETNLIRISLDTKKELDALRPDHLLSMTYEEIIRYLLNSFYDINDREINREETNIAETPEVKA